MTVGQKRGVRGAVLTVLLLLIAIGTFDSQQSFLSAQAESGVITSDGNMDIRKVEADFTPKRSAAVEVPPKAVKVETVVQPKRSIEKPSEVPTVETVREKARRAPEVFASVKVPAKEADLPLWDPDNSSQDDYPLYVLPKPGPGPLPDTGSDTEPGPDMGPGPKPGPGDKPGPAAEGDSNKGHGNDEDGFDEDNPGRGGFGGVGSSKGGGGRGGDSKGSGGRGNSGGGKGSGGRGGGKGRG